MPVKRPYVSLPIKLGPSASSGRLLPDLPQGAVGPANFDEKVNFESDIAEVTKRAGWDVSDVVGLFDDTAPCEAIRGVRRPNGTYAIVGCGSGLIKYFDSDTNLWVQIGSGFSTRFDAGFRWWQIEDIAGYAVFNNGRDLPCTWQIGDAAVTPLYEMREAGYASVGLITEYVDGVLMCGDVLEINDDAMSLVMNDPLPYKTITEAMRIDSENLLADSDDLSTASWTRTNETPSTTSGTLPDGSTGDFTTLTFNASTVARYTEQAVPLTTDGRCTVTAYFRPLFVSGRGRVVLGNDDLSLAAQAEFDTDANAGAGSVAVSALAGAPENMAATIEAMSGGWYRLILTAKLPGATTARVRLQVASASGAYVFSGLETHGWWGVELLEELPGTTRITFRRIWSNVGDPRDFAVTVPGSMNAYTDPYVLELAWPMASFAVGDTIQVNGAGTAGGNLITTIDTIDGTTLTLIDPALTTVVDANVQRPSDIDSIAGYDDIEDDGSAIVLQIALKTQLMTFKASGHIWQTYYTGDLDTPFAKDRVTKKPGVAPRFPRAVVNVVNDNNEEYLLFPGAKHFYRLDLGSQAPQQEPLFMGAERELFFSRIANSGVYDVWAADNACTDEILFAYTWQAYEIGYYGANRCLALKYAKGAESLSEISDFNFTCGATVQKPTAGQTCDEVECWFLMGAGDGGVTLYGQTNLAVLTRLRYGEPFSASLGGGLFCPAAASDSGTYVRRFSLDPSNPEASRATAVSIYGARAPNSPAVLLETKTLTDPRFPGCMGLYYRKPFFKYRLVSEAEDELRISGVIWRVGAAETQDIDRLQ